jgi:hypothetical protein
MVSFPLILSSCRPPEHNLILLLRYLMTLQMRNSGPTSLLVQIFPLLTTTSKDLSSHVLSD